MTDDELSNNDALARFNAANTSIAELANHPDVLAGLEALKANLDKYSKQKKNQPYYTPHHAKWAAKVLDILFDPNAKEDEVKIQYDELAPRSLHLRWTQSVKYLLDHADPDGRYKFYRKITTVSRRRNALVLFIKCGIKNTTFNSDWKAKLEIFAKEAVEGNKFHIIGNFTPDDHAWIRGLLLESEFIMELKEDEALIIKYTQ